MSADQQSWREFEDLIESMHRGFHRGAKITRNEKVRGKDSNSLRDIDICIRQKVGLHELLIAVDCKKRGRKIDAPQMHEFIGLKDDVCAHLGIIVNERGFSKGAINLAQRNNVRALSFRDTKKQNWQTDCRIPMSLEMLIMIPCGVALQYLGRPEMELSSVEGLELTDAASGKAFTPWQLLSETWFGQPDIQLGSWAKRFHFHPNGIDPGGTIDFRIIVEKRRYVSRASLDFLGLVDQQSSLAHISNLETPPINLKDVEKNWKCLPDNVPTPTGIFGLRIKTIMPAKKEGDKITPAFPEKTLKIGITMNPERPMLLRVERDRQTSGGDGASFS